MRWICRALPALHASPGILLLAFYFKTNLVSLTYTSITETAAT